MDEREGRIEGGARVGGTARERESIRGSGKQEMQRRAARMVYATRWTAGNGAAI